MLDPIVIVLALLSAGAGRLVAQEMPDTFQNLQIFPEDISKDQLKKAMKGFTAALGVKCTYCHILDEYDKDEKEHKLVARKMIKLVDFMRQNADTYFKEDTETELIACATCHHGEAELEVWEPDDDDWP